MSNRIITQKMYNDYILDSAKELFPELEGVAKLVKENERLKAENATLREHLSPTILTHIDKTLANDQTK